MEPFMSLSAVAVPLLRDNIDTDTIIPSREMRTVTKKGLADGLFAGWRYKTIGGRDPDPSFVLNDPARAHARILVTGANFGCGSSREHAVWALREYGFRAVIAVSFNPIFRGNCIANGVVPVMLTRTEIEEVAALLEREPAAELMVDLVNQVAKARDQQWSFSIEPEARYMLLSGLDPIRQTLQLQARINAFRAADMQRRPWIYSGIRRTKSAQ
jgi:3-isopropylmalate/(R)-2-methylmalate dehydratase small subunit